eukprot:4946358-Prymnesium_polylepis.1
MMRDVRDSGPGGSRVRQRRRPTLRQQGRRALLGRAVTCPAFPFWSELGHDWRASRAARAASRFGALSS